MFTGIVEELGRSSRSSRWPTPRGCASAGPLVTSDARPRRLDRGQRRLPHRRRARRRRVHRRRDAARRSTARRLGARRGRLAGQPRARRSRVDARLGGHIVQGHVDGTGTILGRDAERALGGRARLAARRPRAATSSRRARSPSTASRSPSSRPPTHDWFAVSLDPHHPRAHHARRRAGRRPRQPRGRRRRQVRRAHAASGGPHDHAGPTTGTEPCRGRLDPVERRRSPRSRPAGRSSSSTTRTARTRATSSSPRSKATPELVGVHDPLHRPATSASPMPGDDLDRLGLPPMTTSTRTARAPRTPSPSTRAT